jgi:hypothetical protein
MFNTKFSSLGGKLNTNFSSSTNEFDSEFKESLVLKGEDGFSPIVEIEENDTGHCVSITDVTGKKSFDVPDGYTPIKGTDYFTETEVQEIA